jgi:8-oxo-dGTP diphosphatase
MPNISLQVGVKALLYNTSRQFLLIKRSAKYSRLVGQWDLPGGRMEPGTNLLTNLVREIREETGLTMAYQPILLAAQDIFTKDNHHIVCLTYLSRAKGAVTLNPDESRDYKWCSWTDLTRHKNLDPFLKEIIRQVPLPLQKLLQPERA